MLFDIFLLTLQNISKCFFNLDTKYEKIITDIDIDSVIFIGFRQAYNTSGGNEDSGEEDEDAE